MSSPVPFFVPLSQILVAFTIEFDNEADRRIPNWTTMSGKRQGVWATSMVMYWNCMKWDADEPIRVSELTRRARTKTNLHGMQRWGYITVDAAKMVRATLKGLGARDAWAPLTAEIEARWQARFGKPEVAHLRQALYSLVNQFELDLPDCMPILHFGLYSSAPDRKREGPVEPDLPLSVLLARTLLSFALDFERDYPLSLAISANVLRVLDEKPIRLRDLPQMSGVSKESIAMALGILRKKSLAVVEKEPGKTALVVRLSARGLEAQRGYQTRVESIEKLWADRFGKKVIGELQEALRPFTLDLLLRGMEPYPDGWRAKVPKPDVLPYYPMVLHRGGFPDGS